MRKHLLVSALLLVGMLASPVLAAETLVATWSTPSFTIPVSVSVNSADGSCWVAIVGGGYPAGAAVVHLAADGTELLRAEGDRGFFTPTGVSVNPADGSCWVATRFLSSTTGFHQQVVHLAEDGSDLSRTEISCWDLRAVSFSPFDGTCWALDRGIYHLSDNTWTFGGLMHVAADGSLLWSGTNLSGMDLVGPQGLAAAPTDGSCWVADSGNKRVVHVAPDGTVLWSGGTFNNPTAVSVSPLDGSCWVVDDPELVHLAADGSEVWRGTPPTSTSTLYGVCASPTDSSVWVTSMGAGAAHLAEDGTVLASASHANAARSISVNSADGSIWMAGDDDEPGPGLEGAVVHASPTGDVLWHSSQLRGVAYVAVSPADGSGWVALNGEGQVAHLGADGAVLWKGGDIDSVHWVTVDPQDGSCWASGRYEAVHISPTGDILLRLPLDNPGRISVGPADGSCWASVHHPSPQPGEVVHFASDGTVLWHGGTLPTPVSTSVNTSDGSCWVAGLWPSAVVHLSHDGTTLLTLTDFISPVTVAVSPIDGSCWVGDDEGGQVIHVAADGTELLRLPYPGDNPVDLSVVAEDGSCWIAALGDVITHVAADGTELCRGTIPSGLGSIDSISANPADDSVWVTDGDNYRVLRLRVLRPTFTDVPSDQWAFTQIAACYEAGIVQGYTDGTYHPERAVTRDQMAAYISRALAGGDGNVQVPTGVVEPTFTDVASDHWAYRYVEYCAGQGIVQGYGDGSYKPDAVVNRGQMAVYVARAVATPVGDAGVPEVPVGATPTFADVTADSAWSWCYKHVEYCAGLGIVQGYADGYHPERDVTRDQMAVYVARAFRLTVP